MRKYLFLNIASSIIMASSLWSVPATAGMAAQIGAGHVRTSSPNLIKVQDYLFQEYRYTYAPRAQKLTYEEAMRRATPLARQRPVRPSPNPLFTVDPYVVVPDRVHSAPVGSPCAAHGAVKSGHCAAPVWK